MKNTYKLTLPTKEESLARGIKFEGQEMRLLNWLGGIAFALQAVNGWKQFSLLNHVGRVLMVRTNSVSLMDDIANELGIYGITCEKVPAPASAFGAHQESLNKPVAVITAQSWLARYGGSGGKLD